MIVFVWFAFCRLVHPVVEIGVYGLCLRWVWWRFVLVVSSLCVLWCMIYAFNLCSFWVLVVALVDGFTRCTVLWICFGLGFCLLNFG